MPDNDAQPAAAGERLFDAARTGDVATLTALLAEAPDQLHARSEPYQWTLLHTAAHRGRLNVVELLLARGLDPNVRERGDNTYPMHWAAAAGHLEVVRRLADAGGDVVGQGDDHLLEVIGWASCGPGCDDAAHRAVVDFLVARGARHHIFSAIALNLAGEVRQIVAADRASLERRMSHNEDLQRPLHFAVRLNRAEMVALLLELGADPLATDVYGLTPAVYAHTVGVVRPIVEAIHARGGPVDLPMALALRDWETAARLLDEEPAALTPGAGAAAVLHLCARRNDLAAVQWLLDRGADPDARWDDGYTSLTPLHLAAREGHAGMVRLLLAAGADPQIRDQKHDSEPGGWADYFGHADVAELLRSGGAASQLHPLHPGP